MTLYRVEAKRTSAMMIRQIETERLPFHMAYVRRIKITKTLVQLIIIVKFPKLTLGKKHARCNKTWENQTLTTAGFDRTGGRTHKHYVVPMTGLERSFRTCSIQMREKYLWSGFNPSDWEVVALKSKQEETCRRHTIDDHSNIYKWEITVKDKETSTKRPWPRPNVGYLAAFQETTQPIVHTDLPLHQVYTSNHMSI